MWHRVTCVTFTCITCRVLEVHTYILWICFHHMCIALCIALRLSVVYNHSGGSTNVSRPFDIKTGDIDIPDHVVHKQTAARNIENKYWCCECERSFSSQIALSRHQHIHTGKYKCTECDKCFETSKDLARHRRIHSGEKPFKCSLCNRSCSRSDNLQLHKRCVHSSSRPHLCSYCGKTFATSTSLNSHVRIHAKPYSCEHCSERFARLDQLKTHLLKSQDQGTWFVCNICE